MSNEHRTSKEQVAPCVHGHAPDLCRLCLKAEIARTESARVAILAENTHYKQRVVDLEHAYDLLRKHIADEPGAVNVAPIARVRVSNGVILTGTFYAPSLPDGEHDLFPVPLNPAGEMRPAYEREGPHCSTCSCGMPAEPPSDDLKQATRLLHIVRGWFWRASDDPDSARVDPLYPARSTSSSKAPLFAAITALLERYPYGGPSETKSAPDPYKRCQHDLLKPATTIEVIDKWKAKCVVCIEFFDLAGQPETTEPTRIGAGIPPDGAPSMPAHAIPDDRWIKHSDETPAAPLGKPCTCDTSNGGSIRCYVESGGRLGELWYCQHAAASNKSIGEFIQNVREAPSAKTRAHPEGSCLIGGQCDHVQAGDSND